MSRAYSDHFNSNTTPGVATGLTDTLAYDSQRRISAGLGHAVGRIKIARASVPTAGMTSGDELRMMRFKSGDRIWRLYWASDGGSTTYAANLGLYLAGLNGTGAVVDADLFGSALALATGAALTECFTESGVLTDEDRGKTCWELAAIGAGSDTVDPMVWYDLVLTSTATGTGAVNETLLIAEYTSGD